MNIHGLSLGLPYDAPKASFRGALDAFTSNRLFAASLRRRLFTDHNPALGLFRVRRSSDDTTLLALPDATGEVINSTITGFTSSGNGFVTTLVDQSGNGNNQTQSLAAAQPQVVKNGTLVTVGGKPAMQGGKTDYLTPDDADRGALYGDLPAYTGTTLSLFLRFAHGAYGNNFTSLVDAFFSLAKNSGNGGTAAGSYVLTRPPTSGSANLQLQSNYGSLSATASLPTDVVLSIIWDGSAVTIRDGAQTVVTSWAGGFDINKLVLCGLDISDIGHYSAAAKQIQELVIWTSNQTANEAAIRTAMLS